MAAANSSDRSVPVTFTLAPADASVPVVLLGTGGAFMRPWPDPTPPASTFDADLWERQYRADLYSSHVRQRRQAERRRRFLVLFFAAYAALLGVAVAVNVLPIGGGL